jgi:hypothetical protein
MRPRHGPHVPVLAIILILTLFLTTFAAFGFGGVLVLALAGMLVGNYLAHRTVAAQRDGLYPRHGDDMD